MRAASGLGDVTLGQFREYCGAFERGRSRRPSKLTLLRGRDAQSSAGHLTLKDRLDETERVLPEFNVTRHLR
jgi:hypothetical protein